MLAKNPICEAWSLEIVRDAEAKIAKIDAHRALMGQARPFAELSEESRGTWLLIEAFPNEDVRAVRNLARRRFAVFRPMQQRVDKLNPDKKLEGWQPVFPGWLFVFCFDAEKQWRRVLACPGVKAIVTSVDDEFVKQVGALNWVYDERAAGPSHAAVQSVRNVKRAKAANKAQRKQFRKVREMKKALKRKGLFDPSTWAYANRLDPDERIALLSRTLKAPAIGAEPHQPLAIGP